MSFGHCRRRGATDSLCGLILAIVLEIVFVSKMSTIAADEDLGQVRLSYPLPNGLLIYRSAKFQYSSVRFPHAPSVTPQRQTMQTTVEKQDRDTGHIKDNATALNYMQTRYFDF